MANISQLVRKNRNQLLKEADHRGMYFSIDVRANLSDAEIIARIVEHDAYYTGRQDERDKREDRHVHSNEHLREQVQPDAKPPRTIYRVSGDDGENYFVKITKDQIGFLNWLLDNRVIDIDYWEFIRQQDFNVEEP